MHTGPRTTDHSKFLIGLWLAAGCAGGCVATVDAAPFVPARDAHCVAISPDGQRIAIGYSGLSNGEFPPRPHPSPRKAGVVNIFDAASRKRLRRIETFGDLTRLAFSADGHWLAVSRLFAADEGIELNEVRVWEVESGSPAWVFDRCHAFSLAPDRPEIIVSSRTKCVAYHLETGAKRLHYPPLASALGLAHSPDGLRLLGIVHLSNGFAIRACSTLDGLLQRESPSFPEPFYNLALPRRGLGLATGHADGQVLLWDVHSLNPVSQLRTGGTGRAFPFFAPDGGLLAVADQRNSDVVVWELEDNREVGRYTFQQGTVHTFGGKSTSRLVRPEEDPARFVFAPSGEAFLAGPYGGILRLVATGQDIGRFGD